MVDYDNQEFNDLENAFHQKRVRIFKACKVIESVTRVPAIDILNFLAKKMMGKDFTKIKSEREYWTGAIDDNE